MRRIVLVAAIFPPALATADEPEPIRVEYSAPASCPHYESFLKSVRARTTRWRDAPPEARARSFVVEVRATLGRLTIIEVDGRRQLRELTANDCHEIVDALALMTALAIDPTTSLVPPPPEPAPPIVPPAPPPPPAPRVVSPWGFLIGIGAEGALAVAPDPMLGLRAFADVRLDAWSHPSVRGFFTRMVSGTIRAGGAGERYGLTTGGVEICPVRLPFGGAIGLRPCASLSIGEMEGVGIDVALAKRATALWIDAGLRVRLEWSPVKALVVGAEAGAGVPFVRPIFQFLPDIFIHQVPAIVGGASIHLGFRFL